MPMYTNRRDYSLQIPFTGSMFKFAALVQVAIGVLELSVPDSQRRLISQAMDMAQMIALIM